MNIAKSIKKAGQSVGAFLFAPSRAQIQFVLFAVGVTLLTAGILDSAHAQLGSGGSAGIGMGEGSNYNDLRVANSVSTILSYLEGSFGALVMVVSGIGAILSAAFGQYKAALGCLVVAVGAFILRSFMSTFFNTTSITTDGGAGAVGT